MLRTKRLKTSSFKLFEEISLKQTIYIEYIATLQEENNGLKKTIVQKNEDRIKDLNNFLEKIPITIAEVKENIIELKYEKRFNQMIKENEDELANIDKNK